jgi:hypothetical protein
MTVRTNRFATFAIFAAAFFSANVRLQAQARAAGKAANVCGLLTEGQVKAVLGSAVQPGQAGPNECTWKDAKGETRVYLSVKDAGIEYRGFRDQMQATGKMVPVTGLAEDAFYIASSGSSAALYALKAKHLILVTVDGEKASKADNEGAEKVLVTQVLPKL